MADFINLLIPVRTRISAAFVFMTAIVVATIAGCSAFSVQIAIGPTPTPTAEASATAIPTLAASATAQVTTTTEATATPAGTLPASTLTVPPNNSFVTAVVLAVGIKGANFDPIGPTLVFTPSEKFHAVVTIENAPAKYRVTAEWFAVDVGRAAPPNTKIESTELTSEGSRNLDFALTSNTGNWPDGRYRVDVLANGTLAQTAEFFVNSTAATSEFAFLDQRVLAKSVRPGTFEPAQPATSFATTDSPIHLVIHISGAPQNTSFGVTWLFGDQQIGNFALISDGTRYVDFTYRQTDRNWSPGNYHANLFVNGVADRTLDFTVQ